MNHYSFTFLYFLRSSPSSSSPHGVPAGILKNVDHFQLKKKYLKRGLNQEYLPFSGEKGLKNIYTEKDTRAHHIKNGVSLSGNLRQQYLQSIIDELMDAIFSHFLHSPVSILSSSRRHSLPLALSRSATSRSQSSASSLSCSSDMDTQNVGRSKFLEFPFVSAPQKKLMVDLVSAFENRFGCQLLPCKLPPDVQYYQNQSGTAQASLQVRAGQTNSPVTNLPLSFS